MENQINQNPIPQQNDLPPMVENPQTPITDVTDVKENPTVSPPTLVASETPKQKSKLMPILLIVLILVLLGAGGVYAYKNFFVKVPEPTTTPVSTPESTPDPTADWKTYKDPILGVEYKLPSKLILAKTSSIEVAGETGTQYCSIYEGGLSVFIKTVYAGGGPCGGGIFTIGTVSKDYSAGREGGFGDYTGYVEVNGKYNAIFVNTIGSGYIPTNLVKEVTNDHGLTYLRIVGENSPQDYGGELRNVETPGTPGEGYMGALVNIQDDVKYRGFNIQMKVGSDSDIQIFDQILSTFKFTDETSTIDTSNWKTFGNQELGFSFSYPKELTYIFDYLGEYTNKGQLTGNLLLQNFPDKSESQITNIDFQIVLWIAKDSGISLSQLAKNAGSETTTNISVGGITAVKGTSVQKYSNVPTIWFTHGGNLFTIQLSTPNSNNAKWFDQILSTFKFTK